MEKPDAKTVFTAAKPKPAKASAPKKSAVKPPANQKAPTKSLSAKKKKVRKPVPKPKHVLHENTLLNKLHGFGSSIVPHKSDNSWTGKLVSLLAEEYKRLTKASSANHVTNATNLLSNMDKLVDKEFIRRIGELGAPAWVTQKLAGEPLAELLQSYADKANSSPLIKSFVKVPSERSLYDILYDYSSSAISHAVQSAVPTLLSAAGDTVMGWLSTLVPTTLGVLGKRSNERQVAVSPNPLNPSTIISKRGARPLANFRWSDSYQEAEPDDEDYGYKEEYGGDSEMPWTDGYWHASSDGSKYVPGVVTIPDTDISLSNFIPSIYVGQTSHLDSKQILRISQLPHTLYGADGVEIEGFMLLSEVRTSEASVLNPDGLGILNPVSGFSDVELSGYFIKRGIKVNPINMGGRLSNIASQYNRYRYKSLKFCYCPTVGTTTAGQFAVSYVTDPGMYESIPGGTYMDYAAITQTEPRQGQGPLILTPFQRAMDDDNSGIHALIPDLGHTDELYYCDEDVVNETVADARQINQGMFVAVSESAGTGVDPGTKWGTIYVHWVIHLVDPVPLIRESALLREIRHACGNYAYEQLLQSLSVQETLFPLVRSLGIVRDPSDDYNGAELSGLMEDLKRLGIVPSGAVYDSKVPAYWTWLEDNPDNGLRITHGLPAAPPLAVYQDPKTEPAVPPITFDDLARMQSRVPTGKANSHTFVLVEKNSSSLPGIPARK